MATVKMTLEGFEATRRVLEAAPQLVESAASSAVATSSFAIAQRAKALVRVDTGRLKAAIDYTRTRTSLTGGVGISDPTAFYWRFVEFGTVHTTPRPFFRPAAEEERATFIQRMRDIGPKLERDLAGGRFL
jgi:HK97 gp10 family phage protein